MGSGYPGGIYFGAYALGGAAPPDVIVTGVHFTDEQLSADGVVLESFGPESGVVDASLMPE